MLQYFALKQIEDKKEEKQTSRSPNKNTTHEQEHEQEIDLNLIDKQRTKIQNNNKKRINGKITNKKESLRVLYNNSLKNKNNKFQTNPETLELSKTIDDKLSSIINSISNLNISNLESNSRNSLNSITESVTIKPDLQLSSKLLVSQKEKEQEQEKEREKENNSFEKQNGVHSQDYFSNSLSSFKIPKAPNLSLKLNDDIFKRINPLQITKSKTESDLSESYESEESEESDILPENESTENSLTETEELFQQRTDEPIQDINMIEISSSSSGEIPNEITIKGNRKKVYQRGSEIIDLDFAEFEDLHTSKRETTKTERELSVEDFIPKFDVTSYFQKKNPNGDYFLTKENLQTVDYALQGSLNKKSQEIVLFKNFNINIKLSHFKCLRYGGWLEDVVINFYLNLINERSQRIKSYPKIYCFNSFFYESYSKNGYQRVRRYTRKVDLFEYDLILIPFHLGSHWTLGVIDSKRKIFRYLDSMSGNNSLNYTYLNVMKSYYSQEHLDKKKSNIDQELNQSWSFYKEYVPQQNNSNDCGVFTLLFADSISAENDFWFSCKDMKRLRKRIIFEILIQFKF
ncbi:deneddylase 1 isoform c-related [Anaeramoeba flamelloides]|uniref:Deneddylase 1 isoform c-related n=1 Tax=Anaeramoeba flamelloides TaxID=1746091 RepID=A0AAV7ZPU5_9EUKA|nr:deneddylase 1 isoform c-related [Anaeramoeba flamelloides]